jgi:hypothetical protein
LSENEFSLNLERFSVVGNADKTISKGSRKGKNIVVAIIGFFKCLDQNKII